MSGKRESTLKRAEEEILDKVINLLPGQRSFLEVNNDDVTLDVAIYQGGYGSGKTWVGALLGILLCMLNPGIRGLCLAKTYPLLRDTTFETYKEHLESFGFRKDVDYKIYNSNTDTKIVFKCWQGSTILFRHLQDQEKIKSINAGFVQVEEISQITESDFNAVLSRARQSGVKRYRVFGHTNPQPHKGWIHKHFVQNNRGPFEAEHAGKRTKIEYRRVIASTKENIYNPPHYVASMMNQFDEEYARIFIEGQDGDYTQGLVVRNWSMANEDMELEYNPDWRIYLTCDFNYQAMCWALAHRVNGEFWFFDEIAGPYETAQAARIFCERYGEHQNGIIITGDASGDFNSPGSNSLVGKTCYTQIENTFIQNGIAPSLFKKDVRAGNPPIADRVAAFNGAVCNAEEVRRVKVNPKTCPKIIYNMQNMRYLPGTSEFYHPSKKELEQDNDVRYLGHMFDAVSYLVERYNPIVRELPLSARRQRITSQLFNPRA